MRHCERSEAIQAALAMSLGLDCRAAFGGPQ
jgi:hypothetical protein